ncbi:hypothetical protein ACOSP7_031455 [Xanthoceras sorbifolium]
MCGGVWVSVERVVVDSGLRTRFLDDGAHAVHDSGRVPRGGIWVVDLFSVFGPRGREFGVWVDGGRDFLVCCVDNLVSEVLSQLQDWNNRRQFTPPSDFHADGVNEFFNSQAVTDGSRANEILKQAPFLVPFTSRVKIFHGYIRSTRWIVLLDCFVLF